MIDINRQRCYANSLAILPWIRASSSLVHVFAVFSMQSALRIIQLISAILLIGAILLQQRGTGLGASFGGDGNAYRTIRGIERTLVVATVVLAVIFFASALAQVVL